MIWLAIAAAGAAGSACRYLVDLAATAARAGRFPWGTLAVNLSGALLIGVIAGIGGTFGDPGPIRAVAAGGFCGAYTTFSTLVFQTWTLMEDRSFGLAAANLASLAAALPATAAGWALGGLIS